MKRPDLDSKERSRIRNASAAHKLCLALFLVRVHSSHIDYYH
jgi:hypothetical protein